MHSGEYLRIGSDDRKDRTETVVEKVRNFQQTDVLVLDEFFGGCNSIQRVRAPDADSCEVCMMLLIALIDQKDKLLTTRRVHRCHDLLCLPQYLSNPRGESKEIDRPAKHFLLQKVVDLISD